MEEFMTRQADGVWTVDENTMDRGKKLGLELLFSVRETVPKDVQNEAIAAALAYLLGRHYASIHELGGPKEAEGWLSVVLENTSKYAGLDGAPLGLAMIRREA
jgi:hypothetical protein